MTGATVLHIVRGEFSSAIMAAVLLVLVAMVVSMSSAAPSQFSAVRLCAESGLAAT